MSVTQIWFIQRLLTSLTFAASAMPQDRSTEEDFGRVSGMTYWHRYYLQGQLEVIHTWVCRRSRWGSYSWDNCGRNLSSRGFWDWVGKEQGSGKKIGSNLEESSHKSFAYSAFPHSVVWSHWFCLRVHLHQHKDMEAMV